MEANQFHQRGRTLSSLKQRKEKKKNHQAPPKRIKCKARRCQSVEIWHVEHGGPAVQDGKIAVKGYRSPGRWALDGVAMAQSQLFTSVPRSAKTALYSKPRASGPSCCPPGSTDSPSLRRILRHRSARGRQGTLGQRKHQVRGQKSCLPPLPVTCLMLLLPFPVGGVQLILLYPMC